MIETNKSRRGPKVKYDAKSDSLYILTKKGMEEEFIEMAPGVNLELNEQGDVIGIEILNASNILKGVTRSLYKQLQMHN